MSFYQFYNLQALVFLKRHNMTYMLFLDKTENVIKKVRAYKNRYKNPLI